VSTRDLDSPPQPTTELPPPGGDPAPRRWSTGHTVAAAVVAVGVFASGGIAWAARDSTGATTGPGSVGPVAGQLPGGQGGFGQQPGGRGGFGRQPGQLGGPGHAPDGTPDDSLAPDDDGVDT
jgi:hypothetical protein